MTDFAAVRLNEHLRAQLVRSEQLRDRTDGLDERLDEAIWLASRIRWLRGEIKSRYSTALKAGANKTEREMWKKLATDYEQELEGVLAKARDVDQTFGNIILFEPPADLSLAFLSMCSLQNLFATMLTMKSSSPSVQESCKFMDYLRNGGFEGAKPQPEQLKRKVLTHLPQIQLLSSNESNALIAFRYFFDPNQTLRTEAFEHSVRWLENLLSLNCYERRRQIPFHRLPMTSAWSVVLVSPREIFGQIDCETEFVARQLDIRIDKHHRGKLAVSPYPESILIKLFCTRWIRTAAYENHGLRANSDSSNYDMLRKALNQGDSFTVIELCEDILEKASFVGEGATPCSLDEHVFNMIQSSGDLTVPPVQYPGLHRWVRFLKSSKGSFAPCKIAGCRCL